MSDSHWTDNIAEVTVAARLPDRYLNLAIYGCSDNGQFCLISPRINHSRISYREGKLNSHDIILEIQGYKVSGYTQSDLNDLVQSLTTNCEPVLIKTVPRTFLPETLKEYLSESFKSNSPDQDLQRVIRDNVYLRVVPCTTRKPRPGEINGFDYQFLTIEEFMELDKNDGLLESGMFDGNYYGTPKPNNRYQLMTNSMPNEENRSLQSSTDLDEWELGPLPDNWEMGYTEDGYRYFIDHNNGTTQWNDPRLPEEISEEQYPNLEELQLDEPLPYGWEKVYDPKYGVFYIDHNNKSIYQRIILKGLKTQYEPPDPSQITSAPVTLDQVPSTNTSNKLFNSNMAVSNLQFTSDPAMLFGTLVRTTLIKSPRGFGFTIIGGSDRSRPEFLQIKHVMPGGPAAVDGRLETGDVLVYVDHTLVLGYLHADIVDLFQCISIGQQVTLTVCKGYPLPFDINDPRAHVVTTMAVNNVSVNGVDPTSELPNSSVTPEGSLSSLKSSLSAGGSNNEVTSSANAKFFAKNSQPEFIKINIVKSSTGFGFTISDNPRGQRVKQILDPARCGRLKEGDILVEINKVRVKERSHQEVVQCLKECPEKSEVALLVQRGGASTQGSNSSGYSSVGRIQNVSTSSTPPILPPKLINVSTAYVSIDSNTLASTVTYHTSPSNILSQSLLESRDTVDKRGLSDMAVAKYLSQQSSGSINQFGQMSSKNRSRTPGPDMCNRKSLLQDGETLMKNYELYYNESAVDDYSSIPRRPKTPTAAEMRTSCFWDPESGQTPNFVPASVLLQKTAFTNGDSNKPADLQDSPIPTYGSLSRPQKVRNLMPVNNSKFNTLLYDNDNIPQVFFVTLHKLINGFGFRIIGGAEDNTKITIGPLVPDGAAMRSGIIKEGDELVSVNGAGIVGATHKKVVQLVEAASRLGSVTLGLRRPTKCVVNTHRRSPFDVTLARSENEGFGFVIMTSMTRSGSHVGEFIGKLIDNSPAQRCGLLRVGDRILSVNGSSVSRMRHEKIVQTIKNCGRSVTLRISPCSEEGGHSGPTSIASYESSDQGSSHRSSVSNQKNDVAGSVDVDFDVTLTRGSKGFGFSIRGGQDFNKMPLHVLRIAEDGPAKLDGRLKVGDKILQINGKGTNGMTHSQAISIIQAGGKSIKLFVRRSAGASQLPIKHESSTSSVHSKSSNLSTSYSPNKRPVVPPNYDGHDCTHRKPRHKLRNDHFF